MKRPLLILTLGFILGIIGGLSIKIVPFVFVFLVGGIYTLKISKVRLTRYLKCVLKKDILALFLIFLVVGCSYVVYLENRYQSVYTSLDTVQGIGTIISEKQEGSYYDSYKIRIEKKSLSEHIPRKAIFLLRIAKSQHLNLCYGDRISFAAEYQAPDVQRNEGGFDYRQYLKTQKVYGILKLKGKCQQIQRNNVNPVLRVISHLRNEIIEKVKGLFQEETQGVFLGITLGYRELISEEVRQNFSDSSLSHLLAVSGMHVSYIVLGLYFVISRLKIHKKAAHILMILLLWGYLLLIHFPASATRAVIMSSIALLSLVVHRRQDTATTISLASFLILLYNPYAILDIGFLLSFAGTIGILAMINPIGDEKKSEDAGHIIKIKELIKVTIAAQILIFPIMLYYFHTISLTFILANLAAGFIIGPMIMLGFIVIILSFLPLPFIVTFIKAYQGLIFLLLKITQLIASIPLSKIYMPRPSVFFIVLYYSLISILLTRRYLQHSDRIWLKKYIKKKQQMFIESCKQNQKFLLLLILCAAVLGVLFMQLPTKLRIHMIDVGQGDACLIVTPTRKTLLVDSGGSETYNIGKNTVHPYLLNKGITHIDYIMISHFDTDHCKGFEFILENMRVGHIFISKQTVISENYQRIKNIAGKKKIPIHEVCKGQVLQLDKYSKMEIISPSKEDSSKDMNDTSIVAKFSCYGVSIVFTGDASQEVEKKILKDSRKQLKATILKVGHHGSKTSTSQEFLDAVNPKVALVGVGKNNKFGHPTKEVIDKLNGCHVKIYRTDTMGEISIKVNRQSKIRVKHHIKIE